MEQITLEQELFELVLTLERLGCKILDIIDITPEGLFKVGDISFRVYHPDKYCFDIHSRMVEADNEYGFQSEYTYFAEYDGFKQLTSEQAITLLKLISPELDTVIK